MMASESHQLLTEFEHILETDAKMGRRLSYEQMSVTYRRRRSEGNVSRCQRGKSFYGIQLCFEVMFLLLFCRNEIGFVHPSQFGKLDNEDEGSHPSLVPHNKVFWHGSHKLGISTDALLPLYKEAKHAFITSVGDCKLRENSHISSHFHSKFEKQVLMHSKAVLLLSSDFGTAWNSRKVVLLNKQELWMFEDELSLSALVLSRSPKNEHAWCHRRWAMKMITEKCSSLPTLIENESLLVEKIAEKCKMNYRAWNHRSLLVASMTREQVLHELRKCKNWARLHVADNCCFHYRRRLLLKLFLIDNINKDSSSPCDDVYQLWREELEWNGMLIMEFIGREALWLHRRFLSKCWIDQFSIRKIPDAEFVRSELDIVRNCSNISDDYFDDFEEQTMLAASYALWLTKKMYKECGIDIREKTGDFKDILLKVFPQRASLYNL